MNIFKNIFHGLEFFAKKISCFLSSPFGTEKLCFSDTKDRERRQGRMRPLNPQRRGPSLQRGVLQKSMAFPPTGYPVPLLQLKRLQFRRRTLGRKKQILKSVYKAQMLLSVTIVPCSKGQKSPEMEAGRHLGYDRTDSCWEPA